MGTGAGNKNTINSPEQDRSVWTKCTQRTPSIKSQKNDTKMYLRHFITLAHKHKQTQEKFRLSGKLSTDNYNFQDIFM